MLSKSLHFVSQAKTATIVFVDLSVKWSLRRKYILSLNPVHPFLLNRFELMTLLKYEKIKTEVHTPLILHNYFAMLPGN